MRWIVFSILTVLVSAANVLGQDGRHQLQTPWGLVLGTREPLSPAAGSFYYAFKGIQFATAGRWEEPTLKEFGRGDVIATQSGPICPQWSLSGQRPVGQEDCLFLNVYTPAVPFIGRQGGGTVSSPQFPVMVFFHPGGYMFGSGDQAGPRRLMRHRNVILVTVNYRLGALGYLSTGDSEIPGNFGILDQITALQWVQKFIQYFGGTPNRVSIFGNSAGASSVHLLMLSPRALGLFHTVIIQSGNALCPWAVEENPREYAETFSEKLQCSGDSHELAACLKEKSVDELITAQHELLELWVLPIRTAPVVDSEWRGDEALLPKMPEELMDAGAFVQVPVMTGVTKDEGLECYTDIHLTLGDEKFKHPEFFEHELLPTLIKVILDRDEEIDNVVEAIKHQYFEGLQSENGERMNTIISGLSDMVGDAVIYSCHLNFLEKLTTANATAYNYVFTYKTPYSPSIVSYNIQQLRQKKVDHPLFETGVAHMDELQYVFDPYNFLPGNLGSRFDGDAERVSMIMTSIWTTFAINGNPANGLGPRSFPWLPTRAGSIEYYNIPGNRTEQFREGESIFWLRTVPYLQELGSTISDLETYNTLFWVALCLFVVCLIIALILGVILWRKGSTSAVNL